MSLIVISGPSGVGKTTVVNKLVQNWDFQRVITTTTRPPRAGEVDGKDYNFVSVREFSELARDGAFLETALVHNQWYGSPKEVISSDKHFLLILDVQGFKSVKESGCDFRSVFLLPPPPFMETLAKRLSGRGEPAGSVASRLTTAITEIKHADEYDHVIINADLEETCKSIRFMVGVTHGAD